MTEVLEIPAASRDGSGIRIDAPAVPISLEVRKETLPITERAVLLQLSIAAWGVDRKLKEHQYEVDANKRMTRAGKKLLQSPELQAIYSLDSACRDWVASRSLPSQFRKGTYLQPVANLLEVDSYIVSYSQQRETLIDAFITAYPDRVLEARLDLRSLFDPRNYPPVERLRERFSVRNEYLELVTAPGSLRSLSGELFAREQRKVEQRWQEALEEARAVLRMQMAGLVEHMVDRLTPGEDGKPRTFRDTLVSGMEEWLNTFSARNLTDDSQLEELVGKARELLHPGSAWSITAETLRSNAGLRENLQRSFSAIREQLDGMVTLRPSRRIRLEE